MWASPERRLPELSLKEHIQAEKARRSLYEFVKQAWHVVEPSTPFVPGWHLEAICQHLESCIRGEIPQLLINMPPRHSKSLIISVFWPMWVWCTNPSMRWLCASYALSLAVRDSRKCRMLIESDWYKARWGNVFYLSKDQNAKMRFENDKKGYRLCGSTESSVTGEGGDALIIDDSISARDANSPVYRENNILWYGGTMSTRLNDPKKGIKVVVMQRFHARDLAGYLLEQGGYEHLNLPAEFVPEKKCFTSIGWSDPRTEPGELLWPAQVPQKELNGLKKALGPQGYSAQFQQDPVTLGGDIFKSEWFRYFSVRDKFYVLHHPDGEKLVLREHCWLFATVDLAISKSNTADYTVIGTWAVTPNNDLLLVEVIRERMDGPEIEQAIIQCYSRWHHTYFKIEKVAFQSVMLSLLPRKGIPVQGYQPIRDKVTRAISASTFYANGQIYHLQFAEYLTDFEPELVNFPKGSHDDCVDVCSMAVEVISDPAVPNIRSLDDDYEEIPAVKVMERARITDWGDF